MSTSSIPRTKSRRGIAQKGRNAGASSSIILSRAQLRQLCLLIDYVFDDEQEHAFNAPDAQQTHIYWRAVRPLAVLVGFRTRAELNSEEGQWRSPRHRSRLHPRRQRSRSRRTPSTQPTTRAR